MFPLYVTTYMRERGIKLAEGPGLKFISMSKNVCLFSRKTKSKGEGLSGALMYIKQFYEEQSLEG